MELGCARDRRKCSSVGHRIGRIPIRAGENGHVCEGNAARGVGNGHTANDEARIVVLRQRGHSVPGCAEKDGVRIGADSKTPEVIGIESAYMVRVHDCSLSVSAGDSQTAIGGQQGDRDVAAAALSKDVDAVRHDNTTDVCSHDRAVC